MSWLHTLNPIFEGNFAAAIQPINSQTHKPAIICATVASSQKPSNWLTFKSFKQSIWKVLNEDKEKYYVLGAQNYFMDQKIYVFLREPIYCLQSLTS